MNFNALQKTSLLPSSLLPTVLRHPLSAMVAHQISQSAFLLTAGSDVAAAYIATRLLRAALAGFSKISRHDVVYSQPRSEYNEHAQRSTQRFDGSRRRSVPGRKRVRGIDPSATPRFSPSDPRNIHCARARCRPPRTDHRGSRLPRNKDE